MNAPRPIEGLMVSLSISESSDSEQRGFPNRLIKRVTLQIAEALLGQGASLALGHGWRDDSLMEAIYTFALRSQMGEGLMLKSRTQRKVVQILNVPPWPDKPYLSSIQQTLTSPRLEIAEQGLPPSLSDLAKTALPDSNLYKYLRAQGLTRARQLIAERSDACLFAGGITLGFQGRYPGVIEEVSLSLKKRRPLYLVGLLGGATAQVIEAIRGKKISSDFCPDSRDLKTLMRFYKSHPEQKRDSSYCQIDRAQLWKQFKDAGIKGISKLNCLTPEENEELFDTAVVDRIIELIIKGLSKLSSNRRERELRRRIAPYFKVSHKSEPGIHIKECEGNENFKMVNSKELVEVSGLVNIKRYGDTLWKGVGDDPPTRLKQKSARNLTHYKKNPYCISLLKDPYMGKETFSALIHILPINRAVYEKYVGKKEIGGAISDNSFFGDMISRKGALGVYCFLLFTIGISREFMIDSSVWIQGLALHLNALMGIYPKKQEVKLLYAKDFEDMEIFCKVMNMKSTGQKNADNQELFETTLRWPGKNIRSRKERLANDLAKS